MMVSAAAAEVHSVPIAWVPAVAIVLAAAVETAVALVCESRQ
jgi:hypothetical protein